MTNATNGPSRYDPGQFLLLAALFLFAGAVHAAPKAPAIERVGWIRIRTTDLVKSKTFYTDILRLKEMPGKCFTPGATCYWLNSVQKIELLPVASPSESGGIDLVGFFAKDLEATHAWLAAHGWKPGEIIKSNEGRQYFEVRDPENHQIAFESASELAAFAATGVSSSLIHSGFIVHDRDAEDRFYKDTLGFHVYWHGGMKEGETNWVDMQAPNGTDWLEYMLRVSPNPDRHTIGVMNHIALGVPNIQKAKEQLLKNGWKPGEEPKQGRDGKWQLNLYDPDDTRVELMEFTPSRKPCCSEYTGPHPKP